MGLLWALALVLAGPLLSQALDLYAAEAPCSALVQEAREFLLIQNRLLQERLHLENLSAYIYNTNITEENRQTMVEMATASATASKAVAKAIRLKNFGAIQDPFICRQLKKLSTLGADALDDEDYVKLQNAVSAMQTNYAMATVCSFTNQSDCTMMLEPAIAQRMILSRDPEELAHYWVQWYNKAGTPMRENFATYVKYVTKAAKLNNYPSNAEFWVNFYEDPTFEKSLDKVFQALLPFYTEVHGFVRFKLRQFYGDDVVAKKGNIPMHLLGNIWGQQWDEILPLLTPFPDKPFFDVSPEMWAQNYTVRQLFELGDDFFKSLNMRPLPESFWNLSVLVRPADRPIVCHASAWDMHKNSDVRIKMCTEINTHYLNVIHHELGHIQYFLQYENQPTVFRDAPNPGFHEAVGDVISMSAATPKHLKRIGLTDVGQLDEESRINELLKTALKKIVFLPFAYATDKYRYAVFRGEIDEAVWNCEFWRLRSKLTGVEPPIVRTDKDFDPPAKYHIDADVEYLRYFASHVFQFQFLKTLCIKAGQYVPNDPDLTLDNCDIYNSAEAGAAFSKLLSLGASVHWKEALLEFTGDSDLDPTALLEYFAPLRKWLQAEIERLNIPLGWTTTDKIPPTCCPPFST